MRKLQSAAAVAAMVGALGFIGVGTAVANGGHHGPDKVNVETEVEQSSKCYLNDSDFNLLSNIGLLNGLLGEGDSGNEMETSQDCSNTAVLGR
ncbi:hypothetical protein [Streptomyces oceani]|uniref:Secreted protein n=1 Tax=Streptomyces oceani TaxID=1075402 RepID=A0A1E7KL61_9ACTN|nr:hypothetical protein [Streptomyces oceani]OEV04772.1 hypothetical protein AN216_05730 [Streptomyces oceani]